MTRTDRHKSPVLKDVHVFEPFQIDSEYRKALHPGRYRDSDRIGSIHRNQGFVEAFSVA